MKYTAYFKDKIISEGMPELSFNQFKRYISIIDLEKNLMEIEKGNVIDKASKEDLNKELTSLTNNHSPSELYNDLLSN